MTHSVTDAPVVVTPTAVPRPSLAQARASVTDLFELGINVVTTDEQLQEVVQAYTGQDFCFDVETTGEQRLDPIRNNVTWIALATHGRIDVIPLGHPNGEFLHWDKPLLKTGITRQAKGQELREQDYSRDQRKWTPVFDAPPPQLRPATVFAALHPVFDAPTIKVGHNIKFDLKSIAKYYDIPFFNGVCFDTMIASAVLDITARKSLAECLRREFGYEMVKGIGAMVERHGFIDVAKYAALDARWTWLLAQRYIALLEEHNVSHIMDLEMDCLWVTADMELTGVRIDEGALNDLHERLAVELDAAAAAVYRAAGAHFNIKSNAEKAQLLYGPKDEGGQGLKPRLLTDGGEKKKPEELQLSDYAVSSEALAKYPRNALAQALLKWAELEKLMGTYVIPYRGGTITRTRGSKQVEETVASKLYKGRIHGQFNQVGTETGRLSSREPNLQNVPNPGKSQWGKDIRNLFVPDLGHLMVVADWSQIEPRIIASLASEQDMIRAFKNKDDIYQTVADRMGVSRATGKELVLSIAYGIGPQTISQRIGCKVTEARELMSEFNSQFPRIELLKKKTVSKSRNQGYVETVLGRRRPLPLLRSSDRDKVSRAERQAFNTLIQGSAGDAMKVALIDAYNTLPPQAYLALTVHDEMVVSCPEHLIDDGVEAVRQAMEGIEWFSVPLVADIKVVTSWGEAK